MQHQGLDRIYPSKKRERGQRDSCEMCQPESILMLLMPEHVSRSHVSIKCLTVLQCRLLSKISILLQRRARLHTMPSCKPRLGHTPMHERCATSCVAKWRQNLQPWEVAFLSTHQNGGRHPRSQGCTASPFSGHQSWDTRVSTRLLRRACSGPSVADTPGIKVFRSDGVNV